tara:strand:- start:508 stop:714 length:207 start_codon:yes stop_codon:yes gene_type:complete
MKKLEQLFSKLEKRWLHLEKELQKSDDLGRGFESRMFEMRLDELSLMMDELSLLLGKEDWQDKLQDKL